MEESQLAGIGKFVMRNRQYLGCLRVRGKTLTLEQMHFADEVDPPSGIVPSRLPSVASRELEMALNLIEGFAGKWEPRKYKDTYTEALRAVVKAKLKGNDVHRAPERSEQDEAPDLMEALRMSVEQMQRGKRSTRGAHARRGKTSTRKKKSKAT